MLEKLTIPPMGIRARLGDWVMAPFMRLVSGAPRELPQRTHRWNNIKLSQYDVAHLNESLMVHSSRVRGAIAKGIVRFHLPICGGWRKYIVIKPTSHNGDWHVGWITPEVIGISRITIRGEVRVLRGGGDALFFGISANDTSEQICIQDIGEGRIGDGGKYSQTLLL